ncbi:MAG: hypothetical protein K2Z81_26575 [Cyanobacteria bacterium]|nr:hypothetical protein [Cyanobacteriota bacterium]
MVDDPHGGPFVNILADAQFDKAGSNAPTPSAYANEGGLMRQISVWFLAFTNFHKIPVFRRVWLHVALMALYSLGVDFVVGHLQESGHMLSSKDFKEAAGAVAFTGMLLGLLLVFRTNAAYDRWWEGRKLWGQLVNDSRNLCLKVNALVDVRDEEEKIRFGNLVISFAFALKHHLRGTVPSAALPGFERVSNLSTVHMPMYVTGKMYEKLAQWQKSGNLDEIGRLQLDAHMRAFMDICGACERIRNTPLAISYRAFIRQGITFNLIAVPWYIPPDFPILWAMPLILIGTYFLIGLELIAEGVEEPFGKDGDDLPLDVICNNIRKSIGDIFDVKGKTQFTKSYKVVQADPLNINKPPKP